MQRSYTALDFQTGQSLCIYAIIKQTFNCSLPTNSSFSECVALIETYRNIFYISFLSTKVCLSSRIIGIIVQLALVDLWRNLTGCVM